MYTKNPQIRISLLIIHIPPSVCHLMCLMVYLDNVPCISIIWLPDPVPSCYFFGKKFILWNVVFLVNVIKFLWRGFLFSDRLRTVWESAWPNFMQCICWGLAKFTEKRSLNCQLISNSVIQIHSFCLVRYYAGLALIVLVLMEGDADGHILLSA